MLHLELNAANYCPATKKYNTLGKTNQPTARTSRMAAVREQREGDTLPAVFSRDLMSRSQRSYLRCSAVAPFQTVTGAGQKELDQSRVPAWALCKSSSSVSRVWTFPGDPPGSCARCHTVKETTIRKLCQPGGSSHFSTSVWGTESMWCFRLLIFVRISLVPPLHVACASVALVALRRSPFA
jgi:hypothetical protein